MPVPNCSIRMLCVKMNEMTNSKTKILLLINPILIALTNTFIIVSSYCWFGYRGYAVLICGALITWALVGYSCFKYGQIKGKKLKNIVSITLGLVIAVIVTSVSLIIIVNIIGV